MKVLLWIVRVYTWLIIIWALSTWFGGFPQPINNLLTLLVWPVWWPFSWLRIGPVGLGAVVGLLLLFALEGWLKKQVAGHEQAGSTDKSADGS